MKWRTWIGKGLLVAAVLAFGALSGGLSTAFADSYIEKLGHEPTTDQPHRAQAQTGMGAPELEQLSHSLGIQAYIYGYPLVVMEQTKEKMLRTRAPLNQFYYSTALASPAYKDIVTPNSSTLYFTSWLDLSKGPVVLKLPANPDNRYYSVQMMDAYTNTFQNVSNRMTMDKAGKVVIAGPSWHWKTSYPKIIAPTNTVWLVGRVEVNGKEDEAKAAAFEQLFTLNPLSHQPLKAEQQGVSLPDLEKHPLAFFEIMTDAMKKNPPSPNEQVLLDQFKLIGIDAAKGFDATGLDPATIAGLERAVWDGQNIIEKAGSWVPKENGWVVGYDVGMYGDHFLVRALVAYSGLAANVPSEELYARTFEDGKGKPLNGSHEYMLHFDKDQLPAADGLWSLTMYGADFYLVPNPIQRYAIGDLTKELQYNPDGSLDIYIQRAPPQGKQSNWLPAPDGNFNLVLRVFAPKPEMLEKRYQVPPVMPKN
ncbi:DUF1254 domain-containing protein [Paenibacillus dokdonensis]|uniref:DUF1254 domain-containing protein n=1 Tax=Paenibacillus dokdonensis TaxID=2567944 RepID=UPI0010A8264A|nr:DUF1254 domain-containing protein [Paenibacillus dokdonensis]